MIWRALSFTFLLSSAITATAMPPFTGNDYSGQYLCKGNNASVGDYEVLVTLKLNTVISHDTYGVYDFSTASNNQATYIGQIMARDHRFAMTFKLLGEDKDWFSTGLGYFKKTEKNQWAFHNTYYEPDGDGGNFGNDDCTMKVKPKQEQSKQSPSKQSPQTDPNSTSKTVPKPKEKATQQ